MKATERTLSQILHSPDQYVTPVFQRYYSWEESQWNTLWEDLTDLLDPDGLTKRHFLGSIVVVGEEHTPGITPSYQVIDGQQRLITLSLLLCAIRDGAREASLEDIAGEIQENYVVHKFKRERERYKVYPRFRDRVDYITLAEAAEVPSPGRIAAAYRWFMSQVILLFIANDARTTLRELLTAITTRLDFVLITLDRGENPYKIFSSLNWKGLPLAEADLIRNYVFMNLPLDEQDSFDDRYWRPLEAHFELEGRLDGESMTAFFRDYLMSDGRYLGKHDTYEVFQRRVGPQLSDQEALAQRLLRYAEFYDMLCRRKAHPVQVIEAALEMVRELETSTTYPLLLALLDRRGRGDIDAAELAACFGMIASFILRRYVCGESSRSYGRWFAAAPAELRERPAEGLKRFLENKGWPDDDRFKKQFVEGNLYGGDYVRQVLTGLERATPHREPADLSNTQIEHVMPQTLTDAWIEMLGENYQQGHFAWLNTPGNLTLTGYNQTLGNRPFHEKKQEFANSNILLNRYFSHCESWTADEIRRRGQVLAEMATRIWSKP